MSEWDDYNETLTQVLTWLLQAETQLKQQEPVSDIVDQVKEQFRTHEVRGHFSCGSDFLSEKEIFSILYIASRFPFPLPWRFSLNKKLSLSFKSFLF